jgi:uncharacterized protein (TIGR03118 family)
VKGALMTLGISRWNSVPSGRSRQSARLSKSRDRRRRPELLEARWMLASDPFVEFNLASNQPGFALVTDQSLGYAWGIATSPGTNGGFSVSDTSAGRANSYSGDVAGSPFVQNTNQTVGVPLATGQAYNGNPNEFIIHSTNPPPGGQPPVTGGPAEFLYASLYGGIYGFNSNIGSRAVEAVSVPGASFTGLTLAQVTPANGSPTDQLYAADFSGGKIDVFDDAFQPVTPAGSFSDSNLPAGYRPFNIQSLGGELYVSYAAPLALPATTNSSGPLPPIPAPGGVVDAFDVNGHFLGRIASGAPLDQPWGMALAPASFGPFAGDLLVANHGNGEINVFNPTPATTASGNASLGTLSGADGNPFVIGGLWGLAFGNGDNAGDTGSLYFTAGSFPNLVWPLAGAPSDPAIDPVLPISVAPRGLLGTIQVTDTDPLVAVGTTTTAAVGETLSATLSAFGSADLPNPTATPVSSPAASYTATIDWGDNGSTSSTPGTVAPTQNGGYIVLGSHAYTSVGVDNYQVTIQDAAGNSVTATGTVQVTAATLNAQALSIDSQGLAIDDVKVAAFTDPAGADSLGNYKATINWGDNTPASQGTITVLLAGGTTPLTGAFFSVAGNHTYTAAGDYTFTVTITDSDGANATVTGTASVSQATIVAKAQSVQSNTPQVNAILAEFVDTGGADQSGNYSATINWSDGTTSAGVIQEVVADPPGTAPFVGPIFIVEGSHTFAAAGDYTFTVAISDTPDALQTTVTGTATVSAPTLVAHALPVESKGLVVDNANVAAFIDTGGADQLGNYSATINWGDNTTTSMGTVTSAVATSNASGAYFVVAGGHTYTAAGDFTFTVTITDTDGTTATVTGTATVSAPTLVAHALQVESKGLVVDNANVAAFRDTGGADPSGNYSATINWGDNTTTSMGTVTSAVATPNASGAYFVVAGGHTYTAEGDYTFTVTISDSDGTSATVTGTVNVSEPTLVAHALPVISQGLSIDTAKLAAFTDTGGADQLSNYSATIDWGDNTSVTPATITGAAAASNASGGLFVVSGGHTYTAKGDYTFTITVSDDDGTSATITGTAYVGESPLLAVGVPVVVATGTSVSGAIVAAFADAAGGDPATDYSATIDWGDGGSTSAGTVTGSGNSFIVTGSHSYAAAGTYEVKVAIADQDGSAANVGAHAFINSSTASLVTTAFQAVLHRTADDSGLTYWTQQIAGGLPPAQFASDLTHSAEYDATNVIDPAYQTYLGRAADPGGVAYWTSQMQQGLTDQQIEANFIASPEFYAHAGGTDAAWVNALYEVVLGRPADSQGLSYWLSQLAGGASRASVALGFAASQEREAQTIQNDYFTYLGRSASPAEVNYWVDQFDNGETNEDIISAFVGSSEYVALHS